MKTLKIEGDECATKRSFLYNIRAANASYLDYCVILILLGGCKYKYKIYNMTTSCN